MAKKFISDWIKFATAGPTIDGREITDQQLEDMAELYDPEEYQAKAWFDHFRFYGSGGDVTELKTGKDKKNRTCLFGKMAPSSSLIELVRKGHYLHVSIERVPNFNKTDKWYLGGIGVTNNPASLGVGKQMQFSAQQMFSGRLEKDHDLSDFIPFELSVEDEEQNLLKKIHNLLTKNSNEEPEMTKEQFAALEDKVSKLTEHFNAFLEKFNNGGGGDDTGAPAADSVSDSEDSAAEIPAEFKAALDEIKKSVGDFSGLTNKITALEEKFNNAIETPAADDEAEHTGNDDFNKSDFI